MILESPRAPAAARRCSSLIRFLSSIWLGIALLTIILVYSSLVSALPPIRWALEMTEMQAFRHGLFVAVSLLFMVALVVTTVVRTRWSWLNMGSILAHTGLLLLLAGALLYFGAKIEGDALVQAPAVQIRVVSGGNTMLAENIPAVQGETWGRFIPFLGGQLELGVVDTQSRAEQSAVAAHVAFRAGEQEPRSVHVSAGDPNWTALNSSLQVRLTAFPPQRHFYNHERPALYLRNLTTGGPERMIEIHKLPIYGERYSPEDGLLRDSRGREIASKRTRPELRLGAVTLPTGWFERWTMPIDVPTDDLPFELDITGYVPYVVNVRQVPGQNGTIREEPVLAVRGERRMDQSVRAMSAIRMRFTGRGTSSNWAQTNWVLFSQYPDIDARPLRVNLPGSNDVWEIVYSRVRHDLGASVTARKLSVQFFPGQRGIKSWHSDILVARHDGSQPYAATVETNNTHTIGPWTLFQSGFAQDHWSYTILGVGNRLGIAPMMVGWIVVTIGCLYAFYVKPLILRRARQAGRQRGAVASRVYDDIAVRQPEPQFADSLRE